MRQNILQEVSGLYKIACRCKNWELALKVKKLHAQLLGVLLTKSRKIPSLKELTDEEIEEFLVHTLSTPGL